MKSVLDPGIDAGVVGLWCTPCDGRERDPRMVPIHEQLAAAYPGRLTLLHDDARVRCILWEKRRGVYANLLTILRPPCF